MDWQVEIGLLWQIKTEAQHADHEDLFPLHAPGVAATSEHIAEASRSLGFDLDESYAQFLRHANGWSNFFQNTRLFGTMDFAGSGVFRTVRDGLALRLPLHSDRFSFEWNTGNCFPIGGSALDLSVFVMERKKRDAKVAWLIGEEIDAFENFEEFFSSMVKYNKKLVEKLAARQRSQ
jgi:hypothetical protein